MVGTRESGKPRRPTALRGIDGGKIGDTEPDPGDRRVVRPQGMTARGRASWDRLAPSLIEQGVLTWWDVDLFRMFCEALSTAHAAAEIVADEGLVISGAAPGSRVTNPAVTIQRAAEDQAFRLGCRFGLNPSDRAGLPARLPKGKPQGLAEFL